MRKKRHRWILGFLLLIFAWTSSCGEPIPVDCATEEECTTENEGGFQTGTVAGIAAGGAAVAVLEHALSFSKWLDHCDNYHQLQCLLFPFPLAVVQVLRLSMPGSRMLLEMFLLATVIRSATPYWTPNDPLVAASASTVEPPVQPVFCHSLLSATDNVGVTAYYLSFNL